jgi:hypothetical protein
MADWCNARLVAVGRRHALARFAEKARSRASGIFRGDMLVGEAQPLRTERTRRVRGDIHRKDFIFQVRNDDGLAYFRQVSNRHRTLSFVLVYADPNVGDYGSYLIRAGTARRYRISGKLIDATMRKHGVTNGDDDDDWRFWEATWELMDMAEARWADSGRLHKHLAPSRHVRP